MTKKENEQIAETLKLLNKKAILEITQKNYPEAVNIFKQSRLLEEKLGLDVQVAESLVNIANTYYLMQDYDISLEHLPPALEIFKKKRKEKGIFSVYQLMAAIYIQKSQFDQAAQIYEKCMRMNLGGRENAALYFQAAGLAMKMNNRYHAQEYFKRSLAEFERLGDKKGIVACLRQRAALFNSMGRKDLAVQDLRKCLIAAGENEELTKEIDAQPDIE